MVLIRQKAQASQKLTIFPLRAKKKKLIMHSIPPPLIHLYQTYTKLVKSSQGTRPSDSIPTLASNEELNFASHFSVVHITI